MRGLRSLRSSIAFKAIAGIVVLLALFSATVGILGYQSFTEALLEQYSQDAFATAETALLMVDGNHVDEYVASEGKTPRYRAAWDRLDKLCNASGATFIYVIRPDLTDYAHITFLFSTINHNSDFTRYDFGYVRETTNDEYRAKYRLLYEGKSDQELVVRDKGYIETDSHITAMVPLRDSIGRTQAILCVQRQMDDMSDARNSFVNRVAVLSLLGLVLLVVGQGLFLNRMLIKPIKRIGDEALRFSEAGEASETKLAASMPNDEIGQLAASIDQMEEQVVNYVDEITHITAEKERIGTELELAKNIQADMLPNTFPAYPDRIEFDIFASMDPARMVGGDFYDFFLVDETHLCMVMADVSGKGVPAALFMMAAKTVLSNTAHLGWSPADVLATANETICANNREGMFVTVWLGILDTSTGKVVAANAGHEYPAVYRSDGSFELLRDRHGFVVGVMDGMPYQDYELELAPGDRIFMYTDGVPEATNASNEQFGLDRMIAALNQEPDAPLEQVLKNVRASVDAFVDGAEQFDDLTMLCVEYRGA